MPSKPFSDLPLDFVVEVRAGSETGGGPETDVATGVGPALFS